MKMFEHRLSRTCVVLIVRRIRVGTSSSSVMIVMRMLVR